MQIDNSVTVPWNQETDMRLCQMWNEDDQGIPFIDGPNFFCKKKKWKYAALPDMLIHRVVHQDAGSASKASISFSSDSGFAVLQGPQRK